MSDTQGPDTQGPAAQVRRIGGNSLVLLLSRGFNTVLAAVVSVLLIRYLGQDEYGLLTTAYAYISFFLLLTLAGVETVVIRDAAQDRAKLAGIVGAAVGLRIALSVGSMVVAWLVAPALGLPSRLALLIVLISLSFPFTPYSLLLVEYTVDLRMAVPKLVFAGWALTVSLVKIGMIALRWPLEAFAATEAVSMGSTFLLAWWLARRSGLKIAPRFDTHAWRYLLVQAWPVALTLTLFQVYQRIDQIMLFHFRDAGEVGLYGASVRVAEVTNLIPIVFMASAFPILSRLQSSSRGQLTKATRLSFRAMMWASLPLAVGMSWSAPTVIPILLGAEFAESGASLVVLAWSIPIVYANSVMYNRLFTSGDQKSAAVLASAAAALNVALNVPLIIQFGALGAAVATVGSYAIVIPFALILKSTRPIAVIALRSAVRPTIAGAMSLVVLSTLVPSFPGTPRGDVAVLLLGGVVLSGIYSISMVALREWTATEWRLVMQALGRVT